MVTGKSLKKAVSLFLEDAAEQIGKLKGWLVRGDAIAVNKNARTLAASAGHFGAKRAPDAACRLELIGNNGTWAEAETVQLEPEKEFKAIESAMKRTLAA
ncbi:MAG: Hpt domain-containing protein [Deltaproteobacteria bacterium]